MAARSAGSGRDNLVLVRSGRWREGLVLTGRDCAMASTTPGLVGPNMGDRGAASWTPAVGTARVFAESHVEQECQRAPRISTAVDRPASTQVSSANVKVYGQPFAITGDTALVEVNGASSSAGARAVEVAAGSVQVRDTNLEKKDGQGV
jgi:hypothetical protein